MLAVWGKADLGLPQPGWRCATDHLPTPRLAVSIPIRQSSTIRKAVRQCTMATALSGLAVPPKMRQPAGTNTSVLILRLCHAQGVASVCEEIVLFTQLRLMERCAELEELEHFFSSTAELESGRREHWFYDRLSFRRSTPTGEVMCIIAPGDSDFAVACSKDGKSILDLNFHGVVSLDIESSGGQFVLIGHTQSGHLQQLFKLRLEPDFSFSLSTSLPSEL